MVSLFCQLVLPLSYLYIYIYIYSIKFLIWLRYWSCFWHRDKSGCCSLYSQFYKLFWLWFYVDFFLNLGFCYNDVRYRHKYLNRQHISIRKTSLLYRMTASPAETPSVTSELIGSVQPAKPALPIMFLCLCENLPKFHVFSARKKTIFLFLFLIEYLISRSWLCLIFMCFVHC